jgi:putative toxin-antitoxin system antitoxin component (TIGR02293 family)
MARTVAEPRHNNRSPGPYDYAMLLGIKDLNWPQLISKIERGLPYSALEHLQRNTGIAPETLFGWLQLAPRTLARRKLQGRLTPEESDRLLRAARVFGRVLDFFRGNRDGAVQWLLSKPRALAGATPFELSRTDLGAREVEDLIDRIRYGVYT